MRMKAITDVLGSQKSARVGTLIDGVNRYSLSLRRDVSEIGTYSVVISDGKQSESFRMKYGGGESLSKCLKHFVVYLNEPNPGRFRVEL